MTKNWFTNYYHDILSTIVSQNLTASKEHMDSDKEKHKYTKEAREHASCGLADLIKHSNEHTNILNMLWAKFILLQSHLQLYKQNDPRSQEA